MSTYTIKIDTQFQALVEVNASSLEEAAFEAKKIIEESLHLQEEHGLWLDTSIEDQETEIIEVEE